VILIATGSEVALAVAAYEELVAGGVPARVVSLPSWHLFDQQPQEYRDAVLPPPTRPGCRSAARRCSAATGSTCPRTARCSMSRCGCLGSARSWSTESTWVKQVHEVLDRMTSLCERVRSAEWRGHTGKPIRNVVNNSRR
jgi:hypothetical protein